MKKNDEILFTDLQGGNMVQLILSFESLLFSQNRGKNK